MTTTSLPPVVTIGLPIYKRLEYLPHVLDVISAQDYPSVELLVSDNGQNGDRVLEIVRRHYSKPFRFRQNPATVSISTHFNQLLQEASGKYFITLCDDDEISANYVSELVRVLESKPDALAAVARQELIDKQGVRLRHSVAELPAELDGADFVRRNWRNYEFGFECFATFMMRRAEAVACGGYPDFTTGTSNDNALLIKLCLGRPLLFSNACTFRWRIDDQSYGWSIKITSLAAATREFLHFLNKDPALRRFARSHPAQWAEVKAVLARMAWQTYWVRWKGMYRARLSRLEWLRAAFALPFLGAYYRQVSRILFQEAQQGFRAAFRRLLPGAKHEA